MAAGAEEGSVGDTLAEGALEPEGAAAALPALDATDVGDEPTRAAPAATGVTGRRVGVKTVQSATASPSFAFVNVFAAPLHTWPAEHPASLVHTRPQNGLSFIRGTSGALHVGALRVVAPPVGAAVNASCPTQPISFRWSLGLSMSTMNEVPRRAISVTVAPLGSEVTTLPTPGIARRLVARWSVAATFASGFSSGKRETSSSLAASGAGTGGGAALTASVARPSVPTAASAAPPTFALQATMTRRESTEKVDSVRETRLERLGMVLMSA